MKKNNCTDPSYLSLFNATFCNYAILYDGARKGTCTGSSNHNFLDSNFINKYCLPSCPLECDQQLFKTSISLNQLIGKNLVRLIKSNPNLNKDFFSCPQSSENQVHSFKEKNNYNR